MAEIVQMPDSEFRQWLRSFVEGTRDKRDDMIRWLTANAKNGLARCSSVQLRDAKRAIRGIISPGWIDRLTLFGRGIIAEHLAVRQNGLSARVLERLPRKALDILNKPDSVIDVATVKGRCIPKRADELNARELDQVVDERTGIRTVEQQIAHLVTPPPKFRGDEEPLIHDGSWVRQDDGTWMTYLRNTEDPKGYRRYSVRLRLPRGGN